MTEETIYRGLVFVVQVLLPVMVAALGVLAGLVFFRCCLWFVTRFSGGLYPGPDPEPEPAVKCDGSWLASIDPEDGHG